MITVERKNQEQLCGKSQVRGKEEKKGKIDAYCFQYNWIFRGLSLFSYSYGNCRTEKITNPRRLMFYAINIFLLLARRSKVGLKPVIGSEQARHGNVGTSIMHAKNEGLDSSMSLLVDVEVREAAALLEVLKKEWSLQRDYCANTIAATASKESAPKNLSSTRDDDFTSRLRDGGNVVAITAPAHDVTHNPFSVEEDPSFTLYEKSDEGRINEVHTLFRRDVLEGFVAKDRKMEDFSVGESDSDDAASSKTVRAAERAARANSSRYAGTIGFRCRFCKNQSAHKRAKLSAIYPSTLKNIYRANIRFQRVHFQHCKFIPEEIKAKYKILKNTKGVSRGSKSYWVESATRKGLRDLGNGEGIVFCAEIDDTRRCVTP